MIIIFIILASLNQIAYLNLSTYLDEVLVNNLYQNTIYVDQVKIDYQNFQKEVSQNLNTYLTHHQLKLSSLDFQKEDYTIKVELKYYRLNYLNSIKKEIGLYEKTQIRTYSQL